MTVVKKTTDFVPNGAAAEEVAIRVIQKKAISEFPESYILRHKNLDTKEIFNIFYEILLNPVQNGINKDLSKLLLELDQGGVEDIHPELSALICQVAERIQLRRSVGPIESYEDFVPPTLSDISYETWINRDKSKKETPPDFILRVYSKWLGRGLLRSHIKIDKNLYQALSNWLRKNKMPDFLPLPNERNFHRGEDITDADLEAFKKVQAFRVRQSRERASGN